MGHMSKLTALVLALCGTTVVAGTAETNKKILVTHARNIDANMADIVKLNDRVDIVKEDLVQNKIDVRRTTILGRRYTADVKGIRETDIPILRTSIKDVDNKVAAVTSRTTAVEAKSESNNVRIRGVLNDVAAIDAISKKTKSDLANIDVKVTGLKSTSDANKSDVARLKDTADSNNNKIGGLNVTVNRLRVDTDATKRGVAGLNTRVDSHDNRLNGLDTNVATVNTRVTANSGKVAVLVNTVKKVDDDAIDSYNLLVKSMLKMQNEYRRGLNELKINRIFVASRLKELEKKK
jgi:chromosome segregation ATPase